MKMWACTTVAAVMMNQILSVLADGDSLPLWKTQLVHYQEWEGYYRYLGVVHRCEMDVLSVQAEDSGGAFVSFTANNTHLDMSAYSEDDIVIVFKMEAAYKPGDHFYDGFQFVVELMQYSSVHLFLGNITHPASNSSMIRLRPKGTWTSNRVKSSDLSIGLAVGISLSLFVICVVISIVFFRWGIKNGYLRHVAMSYKNFRNPRDAATEPPVSYRNTPQESRPEEVNVHI